MALVPSVVVLAGPKAAFGTCWVGFGSSPVPSTRERRIHFDPCSAGPSSGLPFVSHPPDGFISVEKAAKERSVRERSLRGLSTLNAKKTHDVCAEILLSNYWHL